MSLRVSTVTQSHFQAFPRVIFYVLHLCDWRMSHSRLYFLLIRNTEPRVWFSWKHRISCAYWSNDSNVEQNNDKSRCNIRCLGRDLSNHEIWFDSSLFVVSSFHHLFFFSWHATDFGLTSRDFQSPSPLFAVKSERKKKKKLSRDRIEICSRLTNEFMQLREDLIWGTNKMKENEKNWKKKKEPSSGQLIQSEGEKNWMKGTPFFTLHSLLSQKMIQREERDLGWINRKWGQHWCWKKEKGKEGIRCKRDTRSTDSHTSFCTRDRDFGCLWFKSFNSYTVTCV